MRPVVARQVEAGGEEQDEEDDDWEGGGAAAGQAPRGGARVPLLPTLHAQLDEATLANLRASGAGAVGVRLLTR